MAGAFPATPERNRAAVLFEAFLALLLSGAGTAIAAAWLGQDASWDTLNYHFYNPYALLEGRLGWDIQPAARQTYFNPLLDLPFYLLHTASHTRHGALAWGAVQGVTTAAVYGLARLSFLGLRPIPSRLAAAAITVVAFLAPFHVLEIGRATGDDTSGALVLLGLLVVVGWLVHEPSRPREEHRRFELPAALAVAGLLVGAAVGLKPTNGPYALGIALAVLFLPVSRRSRGKGILMLACGGLLGASITGGWWWITLWREFGNPLFPQFNHVFRSEWIDPLRFTDDAFRGTGWFDTLFYPAVYNEALTGRRINGRSFGDVRLPLVLLLAVCAGVTWLARRVLARPAPAANSGDTELRRTPVPFLVAFWLASYVLWQAAFSIGRYTLILEMLSPLVAWALLRTILRGGRPRRWATAAVLVIMLATYHSQDQYRIPFGHSMFSVAVPGEIDLSSSLVLLCGDRPLAFVIPSLPASARFVRIGGNLFYPAGHDGLDERFDNRTGDAIRAAIDEHEGEFYAMMRGRQVEEARREVAHFGFELDESRAVPVENRPEIDILLIPLREGPRAPTEEPLAGALKLSPRPAGFSFGLHGDGIAHPTRRTAE